MAGRGPAPGASPARKPTAQRRRRNAEPQFDALPAEGNTGTFPPLPKTYRAKVMTEDGMVAFLASTRKWYDVWAHSPQATEFTGVYWQRLERVARLVDQYDRHPTKDLLAEIRLQEAGFGGTPMDLRRLGKRIAPADDGAPDAPALASVHRLRAVDPTAS